MALDPTFKDLKCLPRPEREEVWKMLSDVLNNREPPRAEVEPESEPPKKKMALLLMADSESDESTIGAYSELAPITQRYLATPVMLLGTRPVY